MATLRAEVAKSPNSRAAIRERVSAGRVTWAWPLRMLVIRPVLFAFFQALIAAGFAVMGRTSAWSASTAWWPVTAILTNLVCIALLVGLARREGIQPLDLISFDHRHFGTDLMLSLGFMVVSAPLAYFPMVTLGTALFGNMSKSLAMFIRPPPHAISAISQVLFPVTIGLSELPTYYGYVMPRLAALSGSGWVAVLVAGLWLGAQHATLPLIFDARFVLWRLLEFVPFALVVALALYWRPRLLLYLMVAHAIMDTSVVQMVSSVSQ
jgi:hypothetical protein